jgi:ABC-2 type transport system ATP-binding protein
MPENDSNFKIAGIGELRTVLTTARTENIPEHTSVLMRVTGLSKRYGDQQALADVSFELPSNEIVGLIGPNGAGKTTLLEAIAGLIPVDGGDVLWRDNTLPFNRRRDWIFFLPDGLRPWQEQHVLQVIEFFAAVYHRPTPTLANTIRLLGLSPVLRKRVDALSKGFCRRLMLALALLTPHPLLLMDEPFDGFDLRQTREMMNVLRDIAARGRTLVLAIHQLIDAERVCDRFVLLAGGRMRGTGTLDELRNRTGQIGVGLEDVFLALT